jgi:hypothetical protein
MPQVMHQPAAEPATSSRPQFTVETVVAGRRVHVARDRFMLTQPEPAVSVSEDEADARALRDALAQDRIPYDQARRDLGLK